MAESFDYTKLLASIKRHEGFRGKPYQDTTGHTTIGYGRNLDANPLTEMEAEMLLRADIQRALTGCRNLDFWPTLDEVRQRVLIEMALNLGIDGVLKFRKMLGAISIQAWAQASHEMRDSRWAGQVGERAQVLADAMLTGEY